jgi:hypothetical protein
VDPKVGDVLRRLKTYYRVIQVEPWTDGRIRVVAARTRKWPGPEVQRTAHYDIAWWLRDMAKAEVVRLVVPIGGTAPEAPMPADPEIPRHLLLALAHATRAFERGDLGSLATIKENVQPLTDAAIGWHRRTTAEIQAAHAEAIEMRAWAEEAARAENENAEDARRERVAVVSALERWAEDGGDPWMSHCADRIKSGEHRREETE